MKGCMNPAAVNYNAFATEDDGSCVYLEKVNGVCYSFHDVDVSKEDKGFTLSWSLANKNWVYFHTYIPDYYLQVRDRLFSIKDNKIYEHNKNLPGEFYGKKEPWFIDVVFNDGPESFLDTILWLTEVFTIQGIEDPLQTITHLTVWTETQCSGRIELTNPTGFLKKYSRTQGFWSFGDIRDIVKEHGTQFLEDIFHDLRPISSNLDTFKPFFKRELVADNYFIVRFEFDNSTGNRINFHDASITSTPTSQ